MKSILIIVLIMTMAARGCRAESDRDYFITKADATIYKKVIEAGWMRFKYESDSVMYDADAKISAAHSLNDSKIKNKLILWGNVMKAEQLMERLDEKQELGKQFEEMGIVDEKELQKVETYKKDYKKLESKLNKAIEKMHSQIHK